jgi:copper(I)-binding protein
VTRLPPRLLRPAALAAVLLAAALHTQAPAAEPLTVDQAWVPLAPSTIRVHAAYMTVVNRSDNEHVIVGAESPDYERAELHASSVRHGLSEMRSLGEIPVPANKSIAFEPGGMHVMLIGPKRPYASGDRIRLVLRLRGGERIEAAAVVRRRETAPHGHGSH